jgi:hypothetical protein
LMVKGSFLRLTGGAAFLFRGKFKQPFPPAECAHPCSHWCPRLGAAHTPWAARTARVRLCFPRHREPPPGIGVPEAGWPAGSSCPAAARGSARDGTDARPDKPRTRQHRC